MVLSPIAPMPTGTSATYQAGMASQSAALVNAVRPAAQSSGTAPAEISQTTSQIPPVTASRAANATSAARPGAEGRPAPEAAEEMSQEDLAEVMRKREEDEQRKLAVRELLNALPVPVTAIPKLTGDVDVMRSIGERAEEPKLDMIA